MMAPQLLIQMDRWGTPALHNTEISIDQGYCLQSLLMIMSLPWEMISWALMLTLKGLA
jgi:hypothetical protein